MSDQDVQQGSEAQQEETSGGALTEQVTVQPEGVETVKGLVQMGVGKLKIGGGAEALLSGTFTYPQPSWKPEVVYQVAGGEGRLEIKQPQDRGPGTGGEGRDRPYVWDLAFNDTMPLALKLQLGAGHAGLTLGSTALTDLEAAIGSGALMADLSGGLADLSRVAVVVGSGRSGLVMGGDYPALHEVSVSTASGVAEVALGGHCPNLKTLKVNGASGRTSLGMTGSYPALEELVINSASGIIDLNVGDVLDQDLEAAIHCVSGVIKVIYPAQAGVTVRFTSLTGSLDAPGFTRAHGRYVSEGYDAASHHLLLNVSTVSGKLLLQPAAV